MTKVAAKYKVLGDNLRWTSIQSRGEAMLLVVIETGMVCAGVGHFDQNTDFIFMWYDGETHVFQLDFILHVSKGTVSC